jgi:hypothetical protein
MAYVDVDFKKEPGRQVRDVVVNMISWTVIMSVNEERQTSFYIHPHLSKLISPIEIQSSLTILTRHRNPSRKTLFITHTTMSGQEPMPRGYKNKYHLEDLPLQPNRQSIAVRLTIRLMTWPASSQHIPVAMVNCFVQGSKIHDKFIEEMSGLKKGLEEAEESKKELIKECLALEEKYQALIGRSLPPSEDGLGDDPEASISFIEAFEKTIAKVCGDGRLVEIDALAEKIEEGSKKLFEKRKSLKTCVVCLKRPRQVMCDPCTHMAVCSQCIIGVQKSGNKCPICRTDIEKIVTPFC